MKSLKWGALLGSPIMLFYICLAVIYFYHFPKFFDHLADCFLLSLPVIAGVVAGGVTEGLGRRQFLMGIVCAILVGTAWLTIDSLFSRFGGLAYTIVGFFLMGLLVAALVVGLVMKGPKPGTLAAILSTVPAVAVHWTWVEMVQPCTIIPPGMLFLLAGLGAIGSLISHAIKAVSD
jgi:hypothetical protein